VTKDRIDQRSLGWREALLDGRSKAERVADALSERIRTERLTPGTFLGTKATLREQLQISPATLDTALGVLSDRGLVEIRQGVKGGVRVADPAPALWMGRSRWPVHDGPTNASRAGQVMALYLALQPHVVARAVGQLTDSDRERLQAAKAELRDSVGDFDAYHKAHLAAHHALLDASHDEILTAVVRSRMSPLDRATGPAQLAPDEDAAAYTAERVTVHVGVIDAVLDSDLELAWRRLLAHGLTPPDVEADTSVLPAGTVALQERWSRSFGPLPE
jgi:DNA-binding FadR family transcriptional regulator